MKGVLQFTLAIIVMLACCLRLVPDSPEDSLLAQWKQWKKDFQVNISEGDDLYRILIFERNMLLIEDHNSKKDTTYELGLNQFAHLTPKQFEYMYGSQKYLGPEPSLKTEKVQKNPVVGDVDWEKQGMVSAVQSQGQCDAGYAFCSTSLGESYLLFQKKQQTLSNQQIIDCAGDYTTMGCSGGSRSGTLQFMQQKGVVYDAQYPFTGKQGTCQKTTFDFQLTKDLTESNGCTDIQNALMKSPLTVAVNINGWQFYKSGIYTNCFDNVQHDIFLVGVTQTYWRLKNSWGNRWGEYGYIRIGPGNTCGVCEKPAYGFK